VLEKLAVFMQAVLLYCCSCVRKCHCHRWPKW